MCKVEIKSASCLNEMNASDNLNNIVNDSLQNSFIPYSSSNGLCRINRKRVIHHHLGRIELKECFCQILGALSYEKAYKGKKKYIEKIVSKLSSCKHYRNEGNRWNTIEKCNLHGLCPWCTNGTNSLRKSRYAKIIEGNYIGNEELVWVTISNPNTNKKNGYKVLKTVLDKIWKKRSLSKKRINKKLKWLESILGLLWKHEFVIDEKGKYNHHIHMVIAIDKEYKYSVKREFIEMWHELTSELIPRNRRSVEKWQIHFRRVGENKTDANFEVVPDSKKIEKAHRYLWGFDKDIACLREKDGKLKSEEFLRAHVIFFLDRLLKKDRDTRVGAKGCMRQSWKDTREYTSEPWMVDGG